MLALVVLGLIACESAASFKFNKMTENNDRVIYYPNNPSNTFDYKLEILNEKKKTLNLEIEYLDKNIENIDWHIENLDRQIEEIDGKKEYIDREIENFNGQKEYLDQETNIIYKKKVSFDRNIEYLKRQKQHLIKEIEKIDLEIVDNTERDRDRYKVHRAAVEDNEYTITINLPGFNEKEIVVLSGRGRLVVQALHDVLGEPKRSFQNTRSLPDFVSENGSWSYKWDVLRIVFPVIQSKRYKTNNVLYQKGVSSKSNLEKNITVGSTGKAKVPIESNNIQPTTNVPKLDYDGKTTTQVMSPRDHFVGSNTDIKSKVGEVESTTRMMSTKSDRDAKTDNKSKVSEVEVSTKVTSEKDGINTDGKSELGDVEATTQVVHNIDNKGTKTNGKSEDTDVDLTDNLWSQANETKSTVPNKKDHVETTVSVSKQEEELEVTTKETTENDVIASSYIPNQEVDVEATTYAVTANGDVTFIPVVY